MDKKQKNQLLEYQSHLIAWNKTHNLISKKQEKNIAEHIEDSLLISPLLKSNIIDLGSGGGLPGIPLALTNPNKKFYLVESNTKKSAFLLNTTSKLGLNNTTVINQRIEDIDVNLFSMPFDIVCRAVGSTEVIVNLTARLLQAHDTSLKLMKTLEQFEKESVPDGFTLKKIDKFAPKAKDKTRILVTIEAE